MARDVRKDILRTALRLFDAEGSRAIGVDRIIAEAGVAKASFYRHFPSKDDLLVATLEARDANVQAWLCGTAERWAEERGAPPALALFDVVADWARHEDFHGCAFLRATFDAPANKASRAIAAAHKQALEDWLAAKLAPGHGAPTAAALMVVLDGGVAQAFIHCDASRIAVARRVAEQLLAAP